jgi:hypothetical protein
MILEHRVEKRRVLRGHTGSAQPRCARKERTEQSHVRSRRRVACPRRISTAGRAGRPASPRCSSLYRVPDGRVATSTRFPSSSNCFNVNVGLL